jgi:hypothetical protein
LCRVPNMLTSPQHPVPDMRQNCYLLLVTASTPIASATQVADHGLLVVSGMV